MAFKMKGYSYPGKAPLKQKATDKPSQEEREKYGWEGSEKLKKAIESGDVVKVGPGKGKKAISKAAAEAASEAAGSMVKDLISKKKGKSPMKNAEKGGRVLSTKQTQKSLTRREINKKLKDEKKFQKEQQDQNKVYWTGGNKTKVPGRFSSRLKKEKYLNARDEKAKDKRKKAMSRETYKKYTDAGIDPTTMKPINKK